MLNIPAQATRLDIAAVHVTSSPAIKIAIIKGLPLVDERYSYTKSDSQSGELSVLLR